MSSNKVPVARQVTPKYRSLRGVHGELEGTFPLGDGETVLVDGSIRVRTGIGLRRLGDLRLTNLRLLLISHYAFQPDRGYEFPRGSLTRVTRSGSLWTLVYRTESSEGRIAIEQHLQLDDAMREWGSDAPEGIG
jgi:hypothetical protein